MRRLLVLTTLAVAVAVLVGCGDDGDDVSLDPPPDELGTDPSTPSDEGIDAEVIHLGEGSPPRGGDESVHVVPVDDVGVATRLFSPGERDGITAAIRDADLVDRTLLAGVVHVGCFSAGDVSVVVEDGAPVFHAEDLDPEEGQVECARAIVTAAVVSVATDDLPSDVGPTTTTDPDIEIDSPAAGGDDIDGEVVLLEPTRYESHEVTGPGLVRDRVDLEAILGRYGLDEPSRDLLDRVERGDQVLVPFRVGGACSLPTDVSVVRTEDGLWPVVFEDPDADDLVCDEVVQGLALVAVAAADVEGVTSVSDAPADGETGVGVVQTVLSVDIGAQPLAARFGEVDLGDIPGAPDLDLAGPEDGAVRLIFVVEACAPDTAELVADHDAGTVRAEAQQAAERVECDAYSPYLVIADLAPDHTDLTPTV